VFRYARRTFAAWPGDLFTRSLLPAFLARRRSWVFLRPSQVCSRKRVSRRYQRSGPTCRFARRASVPIDFRRADRSPGGKSANQKASAGDFLFYATFDFWASLPSAIRIPQPHLLQLGHEIDPASGFASCRVVGACLRIRIGLDPDRIISLRDPTAHVSLRAAHPNPLMGFRACADDEPAHPPSLQRIDGADALSA